MVQCNGRYNIEYPIFKQLIDNGDWEICIQINEIWTAERHLIYIYGLISSNANVLIQFMVDSNTLTNVRSIDVYLTSECHETESISSPKHFRLIKTR